LTIDKEEREILRSTTTSFTKGGRRGDTPSLRTFFYPIKEGAEDFPSKEGKRG